RHFPPPGLAASEPSSGKKFSTGAGNESTLLGRHARRASGRSSRRPPPMSEIDDYLLYTLSACREMSWHNFKNAFDALSLKYCPQDPYKTGEARHVRWRTLRSLEWLGHAESAFEEGRSTLYAAPPVLARLPISGIPTAVLCGARSPSTAGTLRV